MSISSSHGAIPLSLIVPRSVPAFTKYVIFLESKMPTNTLKNIEDLKLYFTKDYEITIINFETVKYYLPEIEKFSKYLDKYKLQYLFIFTLAYKYGGLFINSKLKLVNDFSHVLKNSRGFEYISFNCFSYEFKCNKDPTGLVFAVKPYSYLGENILKRIKQQLKINSHFEIDLIIKEEINFLIKEKNYKYFLIDKNSNFSSYFYYLN